MNLGAALANSLWLERCRSTARRFERALAAPHETQETWLRAQLVRHAASAFGREHDFPALTDAKAFARRVPLTDPSDVAPWVERVRRGEPDVLACGRVTHLAPTSGSTGARKLIPFNASLQQGFDAAVGAWMADLARERPALRWGSSYWSVSPLTDEDPSDRTDDAVPIGFADDADYLGGAAAWLVRRALAVPASVRHVRNAAEFWHRTRLALLRERDLRVISVWHPSFLDLLVGVTGPEWDALLTTIGGAREAELERIGREDWPRWWPHLQVVSCWGDQAAAAGCRRIAERLPHVLVQPKGLLATEAVVTIPFRGATPLAVTSHFHEFIDADGEIRGAHQLVRGAHYEVVVSNGGGLWRYRLGDVVECTGHLAETPTLRFVGRAGAGSDLRGEKLSEAFVAEVLRALWPAEGAPAYAALRAWDRGHEAGYDLLVSAEDPQGGTAADTDALATRLDTALSTNPHYALARRLGQLAPPGVIVVREDRALAELRAHTGRLGDAKPRVLLPATPHS